MHGKKNETVLHVKKDLESGTLILRSEGIVNCSVDNFITLCLYDTKAMMEIDKDVEYSELKDIINNKYVILYLRAKGVFPVAAREMLTIINHEKLQDGGAYIVATSYEDDEKFPGILNKL